jgi:hypothetical protein
LIPGFSGSSQSRKEHPTIGYWKVRAVVLKEEVTYRVSLHPQEVKFSELLLRRFIRQEHCDHVSLGWDALQWKRREGLRV